MNGFRVCNVSRAKVVELRLLLHISNAWQCLGLLRLLQIYWPEISYTDFEAVVRQAEKGALVGLLLVCFCNTTCTSPSKRKPKKP